MNQVKERVLNRIEKIEEEAIDFLAALVKAESVNPPNDTRKIIDIIKKKAKSFTKNYQIAAIDENMPNIFITLNSGGRPQLLYNGHVDTVPIGNMENWKMEPFGAYIEGGYMYGRGVADMKGGVAAMLMAAKALHLENVPLKGALVLNFVGDEEKGGENGVKYLMDKGYYSPDMVVVGEITNNNQVATMEKGVVIYKLTIKGRTAHASTPWVGINAIEKMVMVLYHLNKILSEELKKRPSGKLPPASINFGTIEGGVSYNVVADNCSVLIDRRTLPGETIASATREIREIIDCVKEEESDINATLSIVASGPPFETSPDEQVCQIAKKTMEELNLSADFVGYEQVSDGRFFSEKGIPTILIGPGNAKEAHTPDERLKLEQYIDAIKIYALMAINALCDS